MHITTCCGPINIEWDVVEECWQSDGPPEAGVLQWLNSPCVATVYPDLNPRLEYDEDAEPLGPDLEHPIHEPASKLKTKIFLAVASALSLAVVELLPSRAPRKILDECGRIFNLAIGVQAERYDEDE